MLKRMPWREIVACLIGAALVLLVAWALGWFPAYANYCYYDQTGHEHCASYHIVLVALFHAGKLLSDASLVITAIATGFIAYFTLSLKQSTDQLWQANTQQIAIAKKSADAANVIASAAVRAEQAHVYPVVDAQNIVEKLLSWNQTGNPEILRGITVSYYLKNFGKTPATIIQAGHELVHAANPPQDARGINSFLEVVKVLGPDDSTDPKDCSLQNLSADDAGSVLDGKTTIWFHGFVTYQDVITGTDVDRHLEFWWWYNGKLPRFGWYGFQGSESRHPDA